MNDPRSAKDPANGAAECQSGGSELAQLFKKHNESLVYFLRARLRSYQEAHDVAQEAYVRLLQLDRLGTISYLRTYLFRTALNLAVDRMRTAAVHRSSLRDVMFQNGSDELTPDRVAVAKEELDAVMKALEGLPARPRYAFLLHRFGGLEVEEIASRLGVSGRMVRNYLASALLCCREALPSAAAGKGRDGGAM